MSCRERKIWVARLREVKEKPAARPFITPSKP